MSARGSHAATPSKGRKYRAMTPTEGAGGGLSRFTALVRGAKGGGEDEEEEEEEEEAEEEEEEEEEEVEDDEEEEEEEEEESMSGSDLLSAGAFTATILAHSL